MNRDDHSTRKSAIEDAMIQRAEEKAEQIVRLGKAAYQAYCQAMNKAALNDFPRVDWRELSADYQCVWVAAAQAAIKEWRKLTE